MLETEPPPPPRHPLEVIGEIEQRLDRDKPLLRKQAIETLDDRFVLAGFAGAWASREQPHERDVRIRAGGDVCRGQ